jgi:endonuclease III
MNLIQRYKNIIDWFEENMPVAETELHYTDAYSLLVAVILSAQCTDKRVNLITPALLDQFPSPQHMALATSDEVFGYIKSCSFPNNKAKHLVGMAQTLTREYNGNVPNSIEELQKLPGVGRKTANVIASVIFNKPALAVDTHVFRVAARLGLAINAKTPLQTELQLVKHIPEEKLPIAHHWLILHGRYICKARKPLCMQCGLTPWCSHYQTNETIENN